MKYISLCLLVSALAGGFQSSWFEFTSSEGKFRALFPGEVEHREQVMETAVGDLVYTTYWHQPTDEDPDNLLYSVSFVDYPEHSIHSDSVDFIDSFFHYTIDTSIKSVYGELRYVDDIQFRDFPGRLWRVDYNGGSATIKTRAYLVGRRYYQVQAVMRRDKSLNTKQDRFFDSFVITE